MVAVDLRSCICWKKERNKNEIMDVGDKVVITKRFDRFE